MRVLAPMRANPAYTQSTSQWHVLGRGFVLALLSDREMRGQLLGAWRTRPVPDEGYVTSAAGSLVFRRKLAVLDGNAPGIGPGGELCTKTLRYWGWNHKTSEEASFVEKVLRARRAYWKQDGGNWTLDTKAGNAAAKKETRAAAAADLGPEPSGGPLLTLAARKLVDSRSACALMELVTGSNGRCAELAVPARERPADFACGRLAKTMEIMGLDPGTIKEVPRWEGFGGMDCAR
ncbi:hypothetical protein DFJ74DRAFT_655621 [Hyaloraphidium curvatum]|nr:hypothetical protein DFJ74DRAFT_655621 [Hyaloraphidium curvatum]